MRDSWINEHVGQEARPSSAFEAHLAGTLQRAWHEPLSSVTSGSPRRKPQRLRIIIWAAAAGLLVVAGAVAVLNGEPTPHISVNTTPDTVVSTSVPITTPPPTTVGTTTPATTPITVPVGVATAATPEEQTVLDYLTALAEGRWDDAAALLGQGGLELEGRADLRPLFGTDGTLPSLANALQAWCELPAMCQLPSALASDAHRVTATFTIDGVERSSSFVGATFEGSPLVTGLPLRLPPSGVALADTVACATTDVTDTLWADLDGDGWSEVVVQQHAAGDAQAPYRVAVCGTLLAVDPYVTNSDNVPWIVYTIDVEGDSRDELLMGGFLLSGFSADLYELDGTALVNTLRQVQQSNPMVGTPGSSFGCVDFDGNGVRDLVSYSYRYVGGIDLASSTSLVAQMGLAVPPSASSTTQQLTFALPAQLTEAFHVIAGFCGALQVQTG